MFESQNKNFIRDILLKELPMGLPLDNFPNVVPLRDLSIPHAPKRLLNLSKHEYRLAIENALRYFPEKYHSILAEEFVKELQEYGHVYMYRFRPTSYEMKAYPIDMYPAKSLHGIFKTSYELVIVDDDDDVYLNIIL